MSVPLDEATAADSKFTSHSRRYSG